MSEPEIILPEGKLLACPKCGNTTLWSDEEASILYPVNMFDRGQFGVQAEYTGDSYLVMDEGSTYRRDVWCRDCSTQLTPDQLVEAKP